MGISSLTPPLRELYVNTAITKKKNRHFLVLFPSCAPVSRNNNSNISSCCSNSPLTSKNGQKECCCGSNGQTLNLFVNDEDFYGRILISFFRLFLRVFSSLLVVFAFLGGGGCERVLVEFYAQNLHTIFKHFRRVEATLLCYNFRHTPKFYFLCSSSKSHHVTLLKEVQLGDFPEP